MKKLILVLALSLCLVGCCHVYKETREYPVESVRYYTEIIEDAHLFTTEKNTYEKVDFVYINSNGEYIKYTINVSEIKFSDKSKIVEEEDCFFPNLYLTLEDYEELLTK